MHQGNVKRISHTTAMLEDLSEKNPGPQQSTYTVLEAIKQLIVVLEDLTYRAEANK